MFNSDHARISDTSTTDGLPVAPTMSPALDAVHAPRASALLDSRILYLCAIAIGIGFFAALVARALTSLIALVTNLAYFGRLSLEIASPAEHHLGALAIILPVVGGVLVGFMARYGSKAIRGHGIPEAMEQVLFNESRIPPRLTFLKPLSSAIAIGTGGPFGAEGPIIATGGALGSLVGQLLHTTAVERKTLLAAGAAAGMTAIFGSPVSAVLLAIELLLFEYRPRSLVPVALACVVSAGARIATIGSDPVFGMESILQPSGTALLFYTSLGALIGLLAVGITRALYAIEDGFERLPIHWMWWPAIGGIAVGVVGYFSPNTLGVGYDNIEFILTGNLAGRALLILCVMKFVSWSIALGSGTSGGTLAPLFTIGGGFGGLVGGVCAAAYPALGIDPRLAGLVGMAAIFAGASRALLASVVFAFETTLQPMGLLPLLGGCTAAYLVSCLLMRHTIMTEKIARRGTRVPSEYDADYLQQFPVSSVASSPVITLRASDTIQSVRDFLNASTPDGFHQGYPVIDNGKSLIGVLTRRDIFSPLDNHQDRVDALVKRPPVVITASHSLREAADHMVREKVGRLLVVSDDVEQRLVGIVTRSDLLFAHARRLRESHEPRRGISIGRTGNTEN